MQFNGDQTIKLVFNFALENANSIVWLIFFIALAFFVFYSLMLVYHWIKYGIGSSTVWLAMIIYFTGSFILISVSYLSFIAIV